VGTNTSWPSSAENLFLVGDGMPGGLCIRGQSDKKMVMAINQTTRKHNAPKLSKNSLD